MRTRSFNRVISLVLTLCLILTAILSTAVFTGSAASAITIENMGDYACADFSNRRLFTLKGTKLYLYDLSYGGGYVLFDYAQLSNDSTLNFLDAKIVGTKIYTLFSDSQRCYLSYIDLNKMQSTTNTLNFSCQKFIAFENGDIMATLVNGNTDYLFYLKSSGTHNFFPLTEHIYDFYGAMDNTVYYKNASGISYATFNDSSFTQSKKIISDISAPVYNRTAPLEFIGNGLVASNTGNVYSALSNTSFSKKLSFNRSGYAYTSGSVSVWLSGAGLILGADGANTLSAYDVSTNAFVASVSTVYKPFLLLTNGSSIVCIEKNNDSYYFETFEISDFIESEPTVYNLNIESVYAGRTRESVAAQYSEAVRGIDFSQQVLSQQGSLSSPYEGTFIENGVQNSLIRFSNYLRRLAGLSDYEYGGDDKAVTVGKGSVLLSVIWSLANYTGHTPPKPTDMSDEFYNEAFSVCGGNISYGFSGTVYDQINAIRSLNDDVHNASNQETDMNGYHQGYNTPGHRNCFLQRGGNKLTYGYADRVLLQYYEYAQSSPNASGTINETGNNEAAYAWPSPRVFPAQEIDPRAVWTVYFNTDKLDTGRLEPVITITDLDTGETFVRNTEMHNVEGQREGYSTCNYWGKSLSFTPPAADSFSGKSYKVTIENLIDSNKYPATVEYTINFFDYNGEFIIDGVNYLMNEYGELTPLEQPTTVEPTTEESTTAVPATEEPTTEEPTTAVPTTEEPTTEEIDRFLNVRSISNMFPSADYTIKVNGNSEHFDISYYWNRDIKLDSYKWTISYDKDKIRCYTYFTDRGSVNDFTEGNITSTWSNSNYPLVFSAGDEFARFSFEALSDGDTTVTFNIDDIVEHQEVVPTTEEPTTAQPSTAAPTTEEPTTAQLSTAAPTTLEPTTAQPSTSAPTTEEPTTAQPSSAANTTMEPTTAPLVQLNIGDVNGDGHVDVLDATKIQMHSSEKIYLNELQLYVGDVNDDGHVDVLDAAMIQKYSSEIITEFIKKS